MLQTIRQRFQGWVAGIIVGIIAITFVFWGIQSYLQSRSVHASNIVVDKVDISHHEFERVYRQMLDQHRTEAVDQTHDYLLTSQQDAQLKQQAAEFLINNTVLQQAALHSGFHVSLQQAESVLVQLPAFQQDGKFSVPKFQQILSKALYSPQTFMMRIQQGMLINQMRAGFMESAFILPDEWRQGVRLILQIRQINYVRIPDTSFAMPAITQAQSKAYYKIHRSDFKTPEKVSIAYLRVSLADIAKRIQPSDKDIQAYYQENIDRYTLPAHWRLAHILVEIPKQSTSEQMEKIRKKAQSLHARLQKGASFAVLAKQYSADRVSALHGGILPWITLGTLDSTIEQAVVSLQHVGQLSAVVQTSDGFELFKLIAFKPKQAIPFTQVKKRITQFIARRKAQHIFSEQAEQLADLSYEHPEDLQTAAHALKVKIHTSGVFSSKGTTQGIARHTQIVKAAFSDDVLQEKNNSQVISLKDGTVAVALRVHRYIPSAIKPFKNVKNDIAKKLLRDKQQAKAKALSKQLFESLQAGKSITTSLHKHALTWQHANAVTRRDQSLDAHIVQVTFNLPLPRVKHPLPVGRILLSNGDWVIVQLSHIKQGSLQHLTQQNIDALHTQLVSYRASLSYELYAQALRKRANVTWPEELQR